MTRWIHFDHGGRIGFGTLNGGTIEVHNGATFEIPEPSGEKLDLAAIKILPPCVPGKMICLWNNFAANAAKQNLSKPSEPLWFLKAPNAFRSGHCY